MKVLLFCFLSVFSLQLQAKQEYSRLSEFGLLKDNFVAENLLGEKTGGENNFNTQQQGDIIVKGVVSDEEGNPLPGVTITVEGSPRGVITDIDGNYSIDVKPDDRTRILASDDFLGDPVTDIPENAPMSGLQGVALEKFLTTAGEGKLHIIAQHRHNRVDTFFIDKHKINILLNGHSHTPRVSLVGSTPTTSIRSGVVCRSGNIEIWDKTLVFFRIIHIDGDEFQYSPPLRFCENPNAPYEELRMNLTLDYKNDNCGKHFSNEVLLTNKLGVDLPNCRIRFVMPKGKYRVSEGVIHQVIETPELSILDINVDVAASGSTLVKALQQ